MEKTHLFTFIDYYPTARMKGAIQIMAALAEAPLKMNPVPPANAKRPDVLRECGTLAQLPGLRLPEGTYISGYGTIVRYFAKLAGSDLYGCNVAQSAEVDQWIDLAFTELFEVLFNYLGPMTGGPFPVTKEAYDKATRNLRNWSKIISAHLELRSFLVGNTLTAADVCVASILSIIFSLGIDSRFAKNYTHLTRWLKHVTSSPVWQKVFGVFKIQQKSLPAVHFAEGEKPEEKKEEKKGQKKQKKEQKKETVKPEPPKRDNIFEDLESLKETKFNFFDYKTFFFQHGNKQEALEELYKQFDEEGFSVWKIKYDKAEGECEVIYQTANLLKGFIQRFHDGFRKYALGVHGIFGEEPNLELKGLWILRGKKFPRVWKEHPTTEYYEPEELDIKKEEHRKLIEAYLTAKEGGTVEGKTAHRLTFYK